MEMYPEANILKADILSDCYDLLYLYKNIKDFKKQYLEFLSPPKTSIIECYINRLNRFNILNESNNLNDFGLMLNLMPYDFVYKYCLFLGFYYKCDFDVLKIV